MNEEPTFQRPVLNETPPTQTPNPAQFPVKKSHKGIKRTLITILVLLLLGAVGYGVYYMWTQNRDLQTNLSSEQEKNKTLTDKNVALQMIATGIPEDNTATTTLPSGKTFTYPLTEDNAQILLWQDASGGVVISHKQALEYVSSVPGDTRKAVCASNSSTYVDQKDIAMGFIDTAKKALVHNQYANCLQVMASVSNKDVASQAAAQKVETKVNADITAFIASATIK